MCEEACDEIKILAKGLMMIAHQYNSYTINSFNFHTQSYDENRGFQSSGIALLAKTTRFERGNDDNQIVEKTSIMVSLKKFLNCIITTKEMLCFSSVIGLITMYTTNGFEQINLGSPP
jgi:hypothetical protein